MRWWWWLLSLDASEILDRWTCLSCWEQEEVQRGGSSRDATDLDGDDIDDDAATACDTDTGKRTAVKWMERRQASLDE